MRIDDTKPVDLSKPVQTRNGHEVRIYTTKGACDEDPVVGEYLSKNQGWITASWRIDGSRATNYLHATWLVNVPQQHTVTVNVYNNNFGSIWIVGHDSRSEADEDAQKERIACFEVTFTEGEGLE